VIKFENSKNSNLVVSLAKQGNTKYFLISKNFSTSYWIIDTGASYHKIGSLNILSNYEPCDQDNTVFMADGTTSFTKGKGIACIIGLTLKSARYVPDLKCNMLSVSKLTKEKGCLVTFFQSYCVL